MEVYCLGIVKDNLDSLNDILLIVKVVEYKFDIIVIIGGVFVGDYDLV